jgi:hypothetical protein
VQHPGLGSIESGTFCTECNRYSTWAKGDFQLEHINVCAHLYCIENPYKFGSGKLLESMCKKSNSRRTFFVPVIEYNVYANLVGFCRVVYEKLWIRDVYPPLYHIEISRLVMGHLRNQCDKEKKNSMCPTSCPEERLYV